MAGKPGRSGGARINSGGRRAGAGRPPGSKNPRTIAANMAARLLPYCNDPKQWLMTLMNDPRQDLRLRVEAARRLLPYLHTKPEGGHFEK